MDLKKKASRSISIALVGVSMVTPILNSVSAMEPTGDSQVIKVQDGDKSLSLNSYGLQGDMQADTIKKCDPSARLGGGPSPSAAWTYSKSYKKTLTASQLNTLSAKYQSTIKSNTYVAGDYAYKISVTALGIWGGKTGTVTSALIGIFGKTYHSEIQRSANVLAAAASKKKSVTLNVKEYIRPASGQKMILFY